MTFADPAPAAAEAEKPARRQRSRRQRLAGAVLGVAAVSGSALVLSAGISTGTAAARPIGPNQCTLYLNRATLYETWAEEAYQAFITAAEQGNDAEAEAQSNLMRNYDDIAVQQRELADIAGC
jgi:hypothetical protein